MLLPTLIGNTKKYLENSYAVIQENPQLEKLLWTFTHNAKYEYEYN